MTQDTKQIADLVPSLYLRDNLVILAQRGDAVVEVPLTPPAALEFASMLIQTALQIARERATARYEKFSTNINPETHDGSAVSPHSH
jgi:hypothetical protein